VGRLLLQGNSVTVDGWCCVRSSCCAKEFLIPKEYPIVLSMTTVQNKIAKKLPISFFLVLTNLLIFEQNILEMLTYL
jgi:hypothetical protein